MSDTDQWVAEKLQNPLYAAAPDLLAALILLTAHTEREEWLTEDAWILKQARAAIAKAKGET